MLSLSAIERSVLALVFVLLTAAGGGSAEAQTPGGTATASVTRGPPYGRDDVPYLEARLGRARLVFEASLEAWRGASSGSVTRELVSEAEARVQALERAVEKAKRAPLRADLQVRAAYDALVARIADAHARVVLSPLPSDAELEPEAWQQGWGPLARTLAQAERELRALRSAREAFAIDNGLPEVIAERLSNLERLDEQIREQEERIAFIERIRGTLRDRVLAGYIAYEDQIAAAIDTHRQLNARWSELRATEALRYPEPAPSPAEVARTWFLDGPAPDIPGLLTLWEGRAGRGRGDRPLDIRTHAGDLAKLRQELEQRRFLRDRLVADAERLRNLEVQKSRPQPVEPAPGPTGSSEYARLGERMTRAKLRLEEIAIDSSKLVSELDQVRAELRAKQADLAEARAELERLESELATLESKQKLEFPLDRAAPSGRTRHIRAFVAAETIASAREGVEARQHALRRVEIRRDVLERRIDGLGDEAERIRSIQLPSLRRAYYQALLQTVATRGARVAVVILLALLLVRMVRRGSQALIARTVSDGQAYDGLEAIRQQRARTLMNVFAGTTRVAIYVLALFFVIIQLDIDYGPLLVAAGGLSLAIGFGAQSLVKDFFAGFFILLEGQYSIGDVVNIDGKAGVVEDLNLRTTILRSLSGEVHTIPNGEIKTTTNMTKQWSRAVLDIGVAYEENIDEVIQVLNRVGAQMSSEDGIASKLRKVDVLGLESLADSSVVIRVLLETRPGDQWALGREFRRRAKLAFDELGIEIPWPQRVVTQKAREVDAAAAGRKRRAVRRFIGAEPDGGTGSFETMSVEARDRAGVIAQKEASILEEQAREASGESPAAKPPSEEGPARKS